MKLVDFRSLEVRVRKSVLVRVQSPAPTLIINSNADNSKKKLCGLYYKYVFRCKNIFNYRNFHTPIMSPEGYEIIKNWVRIN